MDFVRVLIKTPNLKPAFSRVIRNFLKILPLCTNTVKPIKEIGITPWRDQIYKVFFFEIFDKEAVKKKVFQIERDINL